MAASIWGDALLGFMVTSLFGATMGLLAAAASARGLLQEQKIAISMDGRGAWRDNVFVERLWRREVAREIRTV